MIYLAKNHNILKSLIKMEFLIKEVVEQTIACPNCKSVNIFTHYCCDNCKNSNFKILKKYSHINHCNNYHILR